MALITKKHFERNDAEEQERYEELLEASCPADEARDAAREYADPLGLRHQFPERCFLCGEKLTIPFVFWAGSVEIGLHIECAAHFSAALKRDVIEHRCGRERAQRWYAHAKPKALQGEDEI